MPNESIEVHPKKVFGIGLILTSMVGQYRKRSILALVLMVAQSFLYNSVFFTFGLVLSHFYKVPSERIGLYLLPLAIGNFCGPLFLGSLFDTVGRKAMIAGCHQRPAAAFDRLSLRRRIAHSGDANDRLVFQSSSLRRRRQVRPI